MWTGACQILILFKNVDKVMLDPTHIFEELEQYNSEVVTMYLRNHSAKTIFHGIMSKSIETKSRI